MRELIPPLYKAMKDLMQFVDADAAAYSEYMVSWGSSKLDQNIIYIFSLSRPKNYFLYTVDS